MDVKSKGQDAAGMNSSPECLFNEIKRSCIDCHTTTTPLWRSGPAGPRSLCNACGIRYRKAKRALLGMEKGRTEKRHKKNSHHHASKLGVSLKKELMAAGKEMLLQRSLGEEEQAAILLMALSCGE